MIYTRVTIPTYLIHTHRERERERGEGRGGLLVTHEVVWYNTWTSNPAFCRSPTSGRLPHIEYGLLSPTTSLVASSNLLKPTESRLHAIPYYNDVIMMSLRGVAYPQYATFKNKLDFSFKFSLSNI